MANIINFGGGKAAGGGSYAISAPIMGVDFTWDGGDNTCQVIDEGSGNWQMRFLSSGNLKFLSNRLIDAFLVGGGGRGKVWSGASARGGGSGYTKTVKSVVLVANTVYPIMVGAGGTVDTAQAGSSSAFGATAPGGYGAGHDTAYANGGCGGSVTSNAASRHVTGGRDGSNGTGAKSGIGQGTTTRAFGEPDGTLYANGGDAASDTPGVLPVPMPNTGDAGGACHSQTSGGQEGVYNGASGIVIIRNHREEAAA